MGKVIGAASPLARRRRGVAMDLTSARAGGLCRTPARSRQRRDDAGRAASLRALASCHLATQSSCRITIGGHRSSGRPRRHFASVTRAGSIMQVHLTDRPPVLTRPRVQSHLIGLSAVCTWLFCSRCLCGPPRHAQSVHRLGRHLLTEVAAAYGEPSLDLLPFLKPAGPAHDIAGML